MTLQRREFLAGTAMAAALGAPARADGAILSFGLTPVFLTNDQELLTLIRGYLEEALGARDPHGDVHGDVRLDVLAEKVLTGELDPYAAADEIIEAL